MRLQKQFIHRYVFTDSLSLDARVLNIACLFGFISCLVALVARIIEQVGPIPIAAVVVMTVSVAVLFVVVNQLRLTRVGSLAIVLTLSVALFPIIFLTNGGMDSAVSCYFALCLALAFILVKGWMRVLSVACLVVVVIALHVNAALGEPIVQIAPPDGLNHFQQMIDSLQSIFVTGFFIGLVFVFQRRIYEDEKRRADATAKELVRASEEALASSRAKGDFLANMSHEIRTPMNAIFGMAELARKSDDPTRTAHYLDRVHEASAHLLGIINDILDMSKIEANKLELDTRGFSFAAVISRTQSIMGFKFAEKNQRFTVDISPDIPDALEGDDLRLAQVITNLLGNAAKFTPIDGRIGLSAKLLSQSDGLANIQIAVSDTGIGITAEQKQRLFNLFEQADSSTSREFGGTGLGLAISKRIVQMMQGNIDVVSTPGEGSVFTFDVWLKVSDKPLYFSGTDFAQNADDSSKNIGAPTTIDAPVCIIGSDSNSPDCIDLSVYNLLVAEDNEINREILLAMLEPIGIAIDFAEDGAEVLERFQADPERYALIFMDLQMPKMNGFEATEHIRALNHPRAGTIPIIAMTANVFKEDIDRCFAAGMNGHLGKPLSLNSLHTTLKAYLLNLPG